MITLRFTPQKGLFDVHDGPFFDVRRGRYVDRVMDDNDVYGRVGRYAVRRIRLPERAASTPPAGSSATRSATRPPTRSGHSPKTAPLA
jgi:hypothetical protein